MSVETEIVQLTNATTALLDEVIEKKVVLDTAAASAKESADKALVSETSADSSAKLAATSATTATTQADRAKTEADRASQISGLSTVAEAVGLAALPLPDVWVPLSDSLRLITGYGREVKVGEDVVSQMVNFRRNSTATYIGKDGQLKTAAVNEPRFEKEGLLIEGQSTNLIAAQTWEHAVSAMNGRVSNVIVNGENEAEIRYETGDVGFSSTAVSTVSYDISAVIGDISKYISFEVKLSRALTGSETIKFYETGSSGTEARHLITASNCAQFVGVFARKSVMDVSPQVYTASGANGVFAYVSDALTAPLTVSVRRVQAEALPFATSYIPTNGAAATRATDYMTGPGPGNVPVNAPFSLATEISVTPVVGMYPIAISMGGLKVEMSEPVAGSQRIIPLLNLSASVPWLQGNDLFGGSKVLAIACDSSGMLLRYGGKTNSGIGGQIESIGDIYVSYHGVCHIRNFRIWHRALTDEQIKGVA